MICISFWCKISVLAAELNFMLVLQFCLFQILKNSFHICFLSSEHESEISAMISDSDSSEQSDEVSDSDVSAEEQERPPRRQVSKTAEHAHSVPAFQCFKMADDE